MMSHLWFRSYRCKSQINYQQVKSKSLYVATFRNMYLDTELCLPAVKVEPYLNTINSLINLGLWCSFKAFLPHMHVALISLTLLYTLNSLEGPGPLLVRKALRIKVPSHPQFMLDFVIQSASVPLLFLLQHFSLLIPSVVWEYLGNTPTNADSYWVRELKKANLVLFSHEFKSATPRSHWDWAATRTHVWNSSNHPWSFSRGRVRETKGPETWWSKANKKEGKKKRDKKICWVSQHTTLEVTLKRVAAVSGMLLAVEGIRDTETFALNFAYILH